KTRRFPEQSKYASLSGKSCGAFTGIEPPRPRGPVFSRKSMSDGSGESHPLRLGLSRELASLTSLPDHTECVELFHGLRCPRVRILRRLGLPFRDFQKFLRCSFVSRPLRWDKLVAIESALGAERR